MHESLENAGARIGMVYTPPELRGRGYGTAITGSLAQLLLNEGANVGLVVYRRCESGGQWDRREAGDFSPGDELPDVVVYFWLFVT